MNKVEFKNAELKLTAAKSRKRRGYIMLTGATGLVGQYLLKDLFTRNQQLAVLVRPTKKLSAKDRIEVIMQRWEQQLGRSLPRPVVLEGNLENNRLGLSDSDLEWVHQYCDRIIHNAAVLKFESAGRMGEPWRTNFDGTRHVVEFAQLREIPELHYVSTAYVSGICDDFFEADFDRNQSFRNDYERSKYEAEKLVREASGFESKTYYRPGIIIGDSQSGFTASYHGLYVYLRLMATLIPHQQPDEKGIRRTPIKMPVDADQPRNLVPVDWVAGIISDVVCRPGQHNKTYHLVPDQRPTHREILEYCYEYFNSDGVQFGDMDGSDDTYNNNQFAQQFLSNVSVYSAYDRSDPKFDKSNVDSLDSDLRCPVIDKQMIFRFLDFGNADRWGKRKVRKPDYECWLARNVERIGKELGKQKHAVVGFNVLGSGGGQWTLTISENEPVVVERGIRPSASSIIEVDASEYAEFRNGQLEGFWNDFLSHLTGGEMPV